ncbi:MAG: hypothetical protein US81_C0010G0001 [Parcubacteria group bacterium GW2011_GWE2_38_18]|nr:MAG: hypothetical protein US81_C0010G0001 [Parcubacteria group bacterium GW2011_GWE2_38_18]
MDKRLRDWIIDKHEKMPETEKLKFLQALKMFPDAVTQIIARNLFEWMSVASFELGADFFSYDNQGDSIKLMESFKEHFAKELAELP